MTVQSAFKPIVGIIHSVSLEHNYIASFINHNIRHRCLRSRQTRDCMLLGMTHFFVAHISKNTSASLATRMPFPSALPAFSTVSQAMSRMRPSLLHVGRVNKPLTISKVKDEPKQESRGSDNAYASKGHVDSIFTPISKN